MSISVFDLFSIGIGPSSSHTIGPMRAAKRFLQNTGEELSAITKLDVTLYGSLAFTGEGHGTNKAIIMGLEGHDPETINPDDIPTQLQRIAQHKNLSLLGKHVVSFTQKDNILYKKK